MIFNFFKTKPVENLIFLHLPKAGGTTLRHIFYKQYAYLKADEVFTVNRTKETTSFLALSQERKAKIKLLIGHFPFGLHQELQGRFKYVTMMREPIERIVSAFYYNKGHESSDIYKILNDQDMSLLEYLKQNIEPWAMNAMTKHLSGCKLNEFSQDCTEEMYLQALKNLEENFLAVGLTERFDDSIELFRIKLKWKKLSYEAKNVTPNKQGNVELSKEERSLIESLNAYDMKLYQRGIELFEESFRSIV